MYRDKNRIKPAALLAVCLVALMAVAMLAIGIHAKYVTSVPLPGRVLFKANLAESVTLKEHKANRNADGTYVLSTDPADIVDKNSYVVMPGVDIPKDPFFTITEKSSVPAYLYVEIVDSSPDEVTYELTDGWKKLDDITDRDVYVYNSVLSEADTQKIPILKDNIVKVSDQYDPATSSFNLTFYGYMVQNDGSDPADIFVANYPTVPST